MDLGSIYETQIGNIMPLEMKYFVLMPRSKIANDVFAHASRAAMLTFAVHIDAVDPAFGNYITDWVQREKLLANKLRQEAANGEQST